MWILYAVLSSFFAGITSILAKCGIKKTDSTVATAIRTIVVLVMSFIMVIIAGSISEISGISIKTWVFLVLSGVATGASWLCYFRALQLGDVNKVVPIDKSSTVLSVLFAFVFLHETVSALKIVGLLLILAGTFMMITKKDTFNAETKKTWLIYAVLSAVFAALTSILGKIGIEGVESNLGTMIRTFVVLIMAWICVFATGKRDKISTARGRELLFILLSGVATGASWLCYYRALKFGNASVVVPIDKLSIVITIAFSYFVFKERLTKKSLLGLVIMVAGTLLMIVQ